MADPIPGIPEDFAYPAWCFQSKDAVIEVYVIDEDLDSGGAWVSAVPQMRVVDARGKDAYICAEYAWDQESYVEDFEPRRVRRRGGQETVLDAWLRQKSAVAGTVQLKGPVSDILGGWLHPGMSNNEAPAPRGRGGGDRDADSSGYGGGGGGGIQIVLECIHADGVDLATLRPGERAIVLQVSGPVGRLHQPEFFEQLVPNRELLSVISRTHFELQESSPQASPAELSLRKVSRNALLLNNMPVEGQQATRVANKSQLGFRGVVDNGPCFLILSVTIRSRADVDAASEHPAIALAAERKRMAGGGSHAVSRPMTLARGNTMPAAPLVVAAVLECVYCVAPASPGLAPDARVIPLPLGQTVEVGRHHQPTFEQLLQAQPQWLTFVSRTHCRVTLTRGIPPEHAHLAVGNGGCPGPAPQPAAMTEPSSASAPLALLVENVSTNVVVVGGYPLAKGQAVSIGEGATLGFVAAPDGQENKFLEFTLRRARMV